MLISYRGQMPKIAASAFIENTARIIGDVSVGEDASVWFYAVIRGDVSSIRIGRETNIQDHCVLHGMKDRFSVSLGDRVTVGHSATLHGCVIEDDCLIGMGAIVLNGARIGRGSIVGAGALVPEGLQVPPGSLCLGLPAKVVRPLTAEEAASIGRYADNYLGYKAQYLAEAAGRPNEA